MAYTSCDTSNLLHSIVCIGDFELELDLIIGVGTYGTVYRASDLHPSPDSPPFYAVKVQPAHLEDEDAGKSDKQFRCQTAVSRHPHVVSILGLHADEKFLYVVMDYLPGGSLLDAIRQGEFHGNDERIRSSFIQLIDAVESCHNDGVFRLHLKPENILLDEDHKNLYLRDFGLATQFADQPSSDHRKHTRRQQRASSLRKADIWSLGITLFGMICCADPWKKARISDADFSRYSVWNQPLRKKYPISEGVEEILRFIFNIEQDEAISLGELRILIQVVPTFYSSKSSTAPAAATDAARQTTHARNEKPAASRCSSSRRRRSSIRLLKEELSRSRVSSRTVQPVLEHSS